MKKFSTTLITLAMLAFLTGITSHYGLAQATWTVDDDGPADFASIQAAVNLASPGDTIIVAAGTYYENVNVGKQLTLLASSTPIIDGNLVGPCITIAADGVTIDGFELKNGTNGIVSWDTDNSTIKNCDIHDNLNVGGNNGAGIMFWTGTGTVDFDNNTIVGNTIYNNDRQGIYIGWLSWPPPTVYSDGNTIMCNTIYNNGLYTLPKGPDESQYGIQLCFADNNTIKDNEIYGHNTWWFGQGVYLFASYDNTVTGNNIHDNSYGVNSWGGGYGRTVGNNNINFNNISGNGFGVWNVDGATVTVDAEYNWWGDALGPSGAGEGSGDGVTDYVDFDPWMNMYYGDVPLSGGFQSGHFPHIWDLTTRDLVISFTYDANGLVDDFGGDAHAWSELGLREVCKGDFNPTFGVEGAGIWLATDYHWAADTFDPDPPGSPISDLDDKLILQKAGGHGEGDYNLPSIPPNPGDNHRIWWDRDGVDPWQNSETANTGGIYNIEIMLHATSDTSGEAYMKINGLDQGFETDGNWNTIELTPAGMTFTGDMTQMQVFYGLYGYGATHSVEFKNIMVAGVVLDDNLSPITSNVMADPNPVAVNTNVTLTATVSGVSTTGGLTIASAEYRLEDDATWQPMFAQDGDFDEVSEDVKAILSGLTAGVYNVCVRGTNTACNVGAEGCILLVVYDPTAGFVTGGGWIMSPEGAYKADPLLTGQANFGFIARYKKGATVATGNTEFQFNAGDLNFHSSSYDWLVVTGSNYARFKGTGTINGSGEYKFMLWAGDGEPDTFRIKIWTEDGFGDESVEYDNGTDQAIGGGSIVIHTKKK